jgi:hypothetical protein
MTSVSDGSQEDLRTKYLLIELQNSDIKPYVSE